MPVARGRELTVHLGLRLVARGRGVNAPLTVARGRGVNAPLKNNYDQRLLVINLSTPIFC